MQTQTLLSHCTYSRGRGRCCGHARHTDHTVTGRRAAHTTSKTFLLRRKERKLGALQLLLIIVTAFIVMLVRNGDGAAALGCLFFQTPEAIL